TPIIPFYLNSGALEIQSGIIFGLSIYLFIKSMRTKVSSSKIVLLSLLLVISGLYKDVILILFSASVLITMLHMKFIERMNFNITEIINIKVLIVLVSVFFSLGLSLFYNHVRYSVFFPSGYIEEASLTQPDILKSLEFILFSLFSFNGGLLAFWGASFFALYTFGYFHNKAVRVFSFYLISFALIGFSRWWAPFGWDSYGNRLMLPIALSILVMAILVPEKYFVKDCNSQWKTYIILLFIAFYSSVYIFFSYWSEKPMLLHYSLNGGPQCQKMISDLNGDLHKDLGLKFWKTDSYYNCARERFLFYPWKYK
ncbi:TPA: hypothetical protein ACGFWZ_003339, partial [Vibrio cholerae]